VIRALEVVLTKEYHDAVTILMSNHCLRGLRMKFWKYNLNPLNGQRKSKNSVCPNLIEHTLLWAIELRRRTPLIFKKNGEGCHSYNIFNSDTLSLKSNLDCGQNFWNAQSEFILIVWHSIIPWWLTPCLSNANLLPNFYLLNTQCVII